jgi:RNA recognition motif-containing protein
MLWIIISVVLLILVAVVALVSFRRRRLAAAGGDASTHSNERNKIYVGNLNYRVRESDLKEMFSDYGNVENTRVVRHIKTRKSQGFAFVTFTSPGEATKALRAHGKTLQGRTLVVRS